MTRCARLLWSSIMSLLACALPAHAAQHLMQIEQIIGGVNGDTAAQAIQLRMRSGSQNFMNGARIRAWDANGMNPVVIHSFVGNVPNGAAGSRILLCTPQFVALTSPTAIPDRAMAAIPSSYLAAGKLTFESSGGLVYWSVAWGGYAGPNTGSTTNDADGQFSPAFMLSLPTTGTSALQFDGPFGDPSTNNAADYIVTAGTSVWTNNAGASFQLGTAPPTGQCCLAGGVCQVLTETACGALAGAWTAGAVCDAGACAGALTGACCNGAACSVQTQAECLVLGGVFRGAMTTCTTGEPDNFIECCRANFDEENGIAVPDIFAFLSAWFGQDERGDFNENGQFDVPDIFAFLSAWFAGCS